MVKIKVYRRKSFFAAQFSKLPLYFIIISFFLIAVILAEAGYFFWTKKKSSLAEITPEIVSDVGESKKGEFQILGDFYKRTLYGKIAKVEGNILSFENEDEVTVEIASNARFYQIKKKEEIKRLEREEIIQLGKIILAGELGSSDVANYKAEIFVLNLNGKPTLLWKTK